jgi:hypothetical protein
MRPPINAAAMLPPPIKAIFMMFRMRFGEEPAEARKGQ